MTSKRKNNILNKVDFSEIIDKVRKETGVKKHGKKKVGARDIVDVITFCEHDKYLGLLSTRPPMRLTRLQRIIVKCFYAGSEGNEDLELDPDEVEWLLEWKKDKDDAKKLMVERILEKHKDRELINEIVLVLGRRSGKTTLASIIATYEAYKCLELYNPQEYYELAPDNPIVILNIATASPQARLLYNEIKARIRYSNYFSGRLNQESSSEEYTYLLTDHDKEMNETLKQQGRHKELIKGSILIQCGHSNSNSLMGSGIICLIFDELAYFNDGTGRTSGDKVYGDLVPNTKAFRDPHTNLPAAKIVQISAPAGKTGVFYKNFATSMEPEGKGMMGFQFPTWDCSAQIKSKDDLAIEFKKNEADAMVRYGAEFSSTVSGVFFPIDDLNECVDHSLYNKDKGVPGIKYFMHVDPALNNHNYAMAIVHEQKYLDKETREWKRKIYIDHIKKWTPSLRSEVRISEVESYIMKMCRKFNIVSITFDDFNSASTIQKFRKKGLPVRRTPFRASYKQLIYAELKDLVLNHDLHLIPDEYLVGEFKSLQYKLNIKGFKVFPDKDNKSFPTDDWVDCVAGAAHISLSQTIDELPKTVTIRTGMGMAGKVPSIFSQSPLNYHGGVRR
jgi:hypothetical protein